MSGALDFRDGKYVLDMGELLRHLDAGAMRLLAQEIAIGDRVKEEVVEQLINGATTDGWWSDSEEFDKSRAKVVASINEIAADLVRRATFARDCAWESKNAALKRAYDAEDELRNLQREVDRCHICQREIEDLGAVIAFLRWGAADQIDHEVAA